MSYGSNCLIFYSIIFPNSLKTFTSAIENLWTRYRKLTNVRCNGSRFSRKRWFIFYSRKLCIQKLHKIDLCVLQQKKGLLDLATCCFKIDQTHSASSTQVLAGILGTCWNAEWDRIYVVIWTSCTEKVSHASWLLKSSLYFFDRTFLPKETLKSCHVK